MIDTFFKYSQWFIIFFPIFPLVVSLFRDSSRSSPYVYILLLLAISLTTDVLNILILPQFGNDSTILLHLYTMSEFVILALFYRLVIQDHSIKISISLAIFTFILFKILDMIFITGTNELDSLAITISSFFFTGLSLFLYWQILQRLEVDAIERFPLFWINSGILFYFAGNLITFMFSNYIAQQGYEYYITHWLLHNFFSLFKYIAFSIGLWLLPRPQPISLF